MTLTLACEFFIGEKDTITIISDDSDGDKSNDTIRVEEPPCKKDKANFSYISSYCVCALARKHCSYLCFYFSSSPQYFWTGCGMFFCLCCRGYCCEDMRPGVETFHWTNWSISTSGFWKFLCVNMYAVFFNRE